MDCLNVDKQQPLDGASATTPADAATGLENLRGVAQKLGPYLLLEVVMPGGSLMALLLYLYQRRNPQAGITPDTLLDFLSEHEGDEQYLAAAVDHSDLERRIRILEHANIVPLFVTFNH